MKLIQILADIICNTLLDPEALARSRNKKFWISMLLANLALAIKRETDGMIDSTINQKENKNRYMTNMNELIGYLSRHFGEYMDADTLTQKFDIIHCLFCHITQGAGQKRQRRVKPTYGSKESKTSLKICLYIQGGQSALFSVDFTTIISYCYWFITIYPC